MRYQPIRVGGVGLEPAEGTSIARDGDERATLPYRYGEDAYYSFDFINDGRWGVTITEVVLPPASFHTLFRAVEVRMFGESGCCSWGDGTAFRPFALEAGGRASIMVRGRFGDCEFFEADSGNRFTHQTMKFRFLGMTRTLEVEIMPFEVLLPANFKCPVPRSS